MIRLAIVVALAAWLLPVSSAAAGQIVYQAGDSIYVMRDDGSKPRELITQRDVGEPTGLSQPAVGEDGTVYFSAFTAKNTLYSNSAAGDGQQTPHYGINSGALYRWLPGRARRISDAAVPAPAQTQQDQRPQPTADGRLLYSRISCIGAIGSASYPYTCGSRFFSVADDRKPGGAAPRPFERACEDQVATQEAFRPLVPNPVQATQAAYISCPQADGTTERLYVSTLGKGGLREVTAVNTPDPDSGDVPDLAWRPDGGQLVFRDANRRTGVAGLHVVGPDGAGLRKVIDEPVGVVFSSPTYVGSSRIAFAVETDDGNAATPDPSSVWAVPADCANCTFPADAQQLQANGAGPAWTPLERFSSASSALASVRALSARRGLHLRLVLRRSATVTVAVRRGSRAVGTVRRQLRAGTRTLSLTRVGRRRLSRGSYRLTIRVKGSPARTLTARAR